MGLIHPFIVGLPLAWLRRRAPDAVPAGLDALGSAGVPVEVQRELLGAVARVGGDQAVLTLARPLLEIRDQPLLFVMLNSSGVADLIDKEQRLNRFLHSHHRVRVRELGARALELEHHGIRGPTPARVESLFVLGVHLTLLPAIGCVGLSARLPASDAPAHAIYRDGRVRSPIPTGDHTRWRLEWQRFAPTRAPMPGLDELLLASAPLPDLSAEQDVAGRAEVVVRTDLAHRWTVAEVARRLSLSTRSLQRELSAAGTSFTKLVERARVDEAARLLADPRLSVTEIGYCCGFSDTAHFSRRFKAVMGAPPSAWRDRSSD